MDPSGNYTEGKGTTGWCIARNGNIIKAGQIYAAEYRSQMEYWTAVIALIKSESERKGVTFQVVCEDYRLYASASEAQINSNLETPQLIGAIKWYCYMKNIPITLQMAAEVKHRWSNEVLLNKNILTKDPMNHNKYRIGTVYLSNHSLDAVRHCLHFMTFKDGPRVQKKSMFHTKQYSSYE